MKAPVTDAIIERISSLETGGNRLVVAIVGPPAAGKSTLAKALVDRLNALDGGCAALLPMDGYHFDNAVLEARGLMSRKGAPETFASEAFLDDLKRIRQGGREMSVPVFDRRADLSRAHARIISPVHRIVVAEGNYLLLDRPVWREMRELFDLSISLKVPEAELEKRLIDRWLSYGLDPDAAETRAKENDLRNARVVLGESARADIEISG